MEAEANAGLPLRGTIGSLPPETLEHVLGFLTTNVWNTSSPRDLARAAMTSRALRDAAETYWKRLEDEASDVIANDVEVDGRLPYTV